MGIALTLMISLLGSPSIYFVRDDGSYALASVGLTDFHNRLCVRILPTDGGASKNLSVDFGMRLHQVLPLMCRLSIADGTIWVAEMNESHASGLYPTQFVTHIHRFSIDQIKEGGIPSEQFPGVMIKKAKTPPVPWESVFTAAPDHMENIASLEKALGEVKNKVTLDFSPKMDNLPLGIISSEGNRWGWELAPYNSIWRKTVHGGKLTDPFYVSIAAISSKEAIAFIYFKNKIIFVKLIARKLSPKEFDELEPTSIPFYNAKLDALEWSSLGVTETDIDTWSTGFWINESLHIVADDGSYECFKIVDGKMQRVIHSVKFAVDPHWMLHGKSGVQILSQTVNDVRVIDLSRMSWWQKNDYSMGNISLDQAARQIFESEGK